MRRVMCGLGLLVCLAAPARAGQMLYATATTPGRVDGFCLSSNGGIDTKPKVTATTGGRLPRRLIPSPNGKMLYVAEIDRVEFFEILEGGGLRKVPQTQVPEPPLKGLNPRDVALSADGTKLYVPDVKRNRFFMFALDANGLPISRAPTSCMFGPNGAGIENLLVRFDTPSPLLYASLTHGNGEVVTYQLDADGRFVRCVQQEDENGDPLEGAVPPICDVAFGPEGCEDGTCEIPSGAKEGLCVGGYHTGLTCEEDRDCNAVVNQPISRRKKMAGPGPLILDGNRLFVSERFRRKVSVFDLQANGTFATSLNKDDEPRWKQARASSTKSETRYNGLVKANNTILGTQFSDGRIDAYRLNDGNLPNQPTRQTEKDVRSSPVRMTVRNNVLYVGGGDVDRVQAYRLTDEGVPRDTTPFSQSDRQKGSFPNEVVIVDVPTACN
jgi:6-phosphogluconolactonase (cycloisomerase 2 family)